VERGREGEGVGVWREVAVGGRDGEKVGVRKEGVRRVSRWGMEEWKEGGQSERREAGERGGGSVGVEREKVGVSGM